MFLKNLIVGRIFLALAGNAPSSDALPSGVMEGHLTILSSKPVDISDENAATVTAGNYADYPLLVLSQDKQKEIVRITADTNGNYRAVLTPTIGELARRNRSGLTNTSARGRLRLR